MNNVKQDLDIIEKYTTREILFAMIKSLNNYYGIPFVEYTRNHLEKHWGDNLWWPNEKMIETVSKLFTVRQQFQSRYSDNSSYSSECEYYVDIYQCNLCGKLIDIPTPEGRDEWKIDIMNPTHSHISQCEKVKEIYNTCVGLNEFKLKLLSAN